MMKVKTLDKKIRIIVCFFHVFFLLILTLFPTNVVIIKKGNVSKVSKLYKVDNKNTSNDFFQTYVYSFRKPSYLVQALLEISKKVDTHDISKTTLTNTEDLEMSRIDGLVSSYTSLIVAYENASKIDNKIKIEYEIDSFFIYYSSTNLRENLPIGEIVYKIDDVAISKEKYKTLFYNLKDYKKDLKLTLKNKEINITKNELLKSNILIKPKAINS